MEELTGHLFTGRDGLAHGEEGWRELLALTAEAHVFHEPEWHRLWLELHPEQTPWIFTLQQGRHMRGIAPLSASRSVHLRALPARRLQVLANDEPAHDNLLFAMDPREGLQALLRELAKRRDWDILTLNTKGDGETMSALGRWASAWWTPAFRRVRICRSTARGASSARST